MGVPSEPHQNIRTLYECDCAVQLELRELAPRLYAPVRQRLAALGTGHRGRGSSRLVSPRGAAARVTCGVVPCGAETTRKTDSDAGR